MQKTYFSPRLPHYDQISVQYNTNLQMSWFDFEIILLPIKNSILFNNNHVNIISINI